MNTPDIIVAELQQCLAALTSKGSETAAETTVKAPIRSARCATKIIDLIEKYRHINPAPPFVHQQTYNLIDTPDRDMQALHLIISVIEQWLPIKLDGELKVAADNAAARVRIAQYLLARFNDRPL